MKRILKAVTPVGTFTRETHAGYTHVAVWRSERAMRVFQSPPKGVRSVIQNRWIKDQGYIVSWHGNERSARLSKGSEWDPEATFVGLFPVEGQS